MLFDVLTMQANPRTGLLTFELITSKKELVIKSVNTSFKYGTRSIPSLQSLKKLHSNSFQIIKTNILDWKNRYRL